MRNTSLIFGLAILIFGGTVLYTSWNKKQAETLVTQPVFMTPTPQSSPVAETPASVAPSPISNNYTDSQNLYSFSYPEGYTLDTQDIAHPRLFKRGQTQRSQSEISDGVLIVFEVIDLQGKSLAEVADARIAGMNTDSTSEVVPSPKATTLNNYPGLTYETQGFGSSKNVMIQKSPTSTQAVLITYMASDPQQVGYQAEVDQILKTVTLLK